MLFATSASAATFEVTNTADSGEGSLRAAISQANDNPATFDVVEIETTGTVQLQSPLPDLSSDMQINGPGPDDFKVRRAGGGAYRIFTVLSGAEVGILGLTVTNGRADEGGGIWNTGELQLVRVAVENNTATATGSSPRGGGIANLGSLEIDLVSITGNTARSSDVAEGGGLAVIGTSAQATVEHTTVSGNSAIATGTPAAPDAVARGGGIRSAGTLVVESSTISDNTASATGGGPSTGNVVAAGGGLRIEGAATVLNSTISGNTASAVDGDVQDEFGGGLSASGGTPAVPQTTIAFNSAEEGANIDGGALMGNTLIAEPLGGGTNCEGGAISFTSTGFNLADDSTCDLTEATDQVVPDAGLLSLADNGGPTQTHALHFESPAIDAGETRERNTDQRGRARPIDLTNVPNAAGSDGADIGSYERVPRCEGLEATIVVQPADGVDGDVVEGTFGIDVIVGSRDGEVIEGLGGDDVICGRGGEDSIAGNSGEDALRGGRGPDQLFGGADNDRLYGERGVDELDGQTASDLCRGETKVRCER